MAKQKDLGDTLEIHYDPVRDSLPKFQKILRKVIGSERKNLWINMRNAPLVPRDYLSPLVLGAKALKAHNRVITFVVSETNHSLLKATPEATYFSFEAVQTDPMPSFIEEPSGPESTAQKPSSNLPELPGITVQDHWIFITDQGLESASQHLPILINMLLQNHQHIVIDISGLFFVTPPLIQTLILETINSGNALTVRITESMIEMLQTNPQYLMLNLDIAKEVETPPTSVNDNISEQTNFSQEPETAEISPISDSIVGATDQPNEDMPVIKQSIESDVIEEIIDEQAMMTTPSPKDKVAPNETSAVNFPQDSSKKEPITQNQNSENKTTTNSDQEITDTNLPTNIAPTPKDGRKTTDPRGMSSLDTSKTNMRTTKSLLEMSDVAEDDICITDDLQVQADDKTPSVFRIDVNCLKAGEMTKTAFLRDFRTYLKKMPACGNLVFIDVSQYRRMEKEIAKILIEGFWWAQEKQCKIVLKMLKEQHQIFDTFLPIIEEVKIDEKKPEFILCGSRLELHNVTVNMFVEKFPEQCKKLQETGLSNLVVDLTKLPEVTDSVMEILIRSYLDAMGKNMAFTVRINADMEPIFQRSNRGRSLPLEVMRNNELSSLPTTHQPKIDMTKIMDAMEKDHLTQRVLDKQFETVHIESRGSVQNWEPAPVKADEKKVAYTGVERRIEKRFDVKDVEVIFARGSIAKIVGRRYPVHNLSQSGLCFTSAILLSRNETLRIKMFREDLVLELSARVVWVKAISSQALFRVGIQFTKLTDVIKNQIRDLLRKMYKSDIII